MKTDRNPTGPLRLGFLALTDAAPVVVAERMGIFRRRGLAVRLSREVGWATIREKIILGELDAAQAPAPMLWAIQLGIHSPAFPVVTGLVLSLNGNAVTIARALLDERLALAPAKRMLTLGVVSRHSAHTLLLCEWLRQQGLDPARDARIVVVPPAQMVRNLEAGTIDGFSAGEPWNTVAVQRGLGCCPTWTVTAAGEQIEKVLLVTRGFAETRASEHRELIAALVEACAWCEEPPNRATLAGLLAERAFLNVPPAAVAPSLLGRFDTGRGVESVPRFHIFHGPQANRPEPARAMELQTQLIREGLIPKHTALSKSLFRSDIYDSAIPVMSPADD
ncbi:MAG TPA: CmpA/NrtA family ABC transporter substrate-binding protein [Opitutaceae bacterium]|jgi:ABC-type nitrate/sulfonate/bicarbonate transport system substrate-binding protein|nr:CmpA/NrtA family ABC transporter substrate-binding protein [Opitutaceae bacterium]